MVGFEISPVVMFVSFNMLCLKNVVTFQRGEFVELSGFVSVAGAGAGVVMPRSSLGRWLPPLVGGECQALM